MNSFLYIILLVLSFSVISCQKNELSSVDDENEVMTIIANIENSKTVNSGLSTKWVINDEISAIHSKSSSWYPTYYLDKYTYTNKNLFEGNPQKLSTNNDWYVVYPYNSEYTNPSSITLKVSSSMTQNGVNSTAHLAGSDFPLFGLKKNVSKNTSLDISMHHGLSVAKYQITNVLSEPVNVSEIVFYSKSNISGTYKVDITSSDAKWVETDDVSSTVTLKVEGNSTIQPGETGTFYCGLRPHTISSDSYFSVKVVGSTAKENFPCYTKKSSSKGITFNAGAQKPIILEFDDEHKTPIDKSDQYLSFESSSISWIIGDTYKIGGSYSPQSVIGAKTNVSWTSSNKDVAIIENNKVKIIASGTTIISANAEETDTYNSASASYTLTISTSEIFNLENDYVKAYLDEAYKTYTEDNFGSVSVVAKYCSNSSSNRKDFPAATKLSWDSSISGTKTIKVYSNSTKTDIEYETTTTASSINIYNLVTNKQYWYTVSANSSVISSGTFDTQGRRRMMKISETYGDSHANNCRDLGGLKTVDGKTLKYNMVFRGTNIDNVSSSEKEYLLDVMKIKMDVDLREKSSQRRPLPESVGYSNAGYSSSKSDLTNKTKTKTTFTDIIETVSAGNACYIHCRIGADRTGYICMLLEAVLGVSLNDCSIDYELTSFSYAGTRTRVGGTTDTNMYYELAKYIRDYQTGKSFKENAEQILLDAGITSQQITNLRNAMLE